MTRSRIRWVLPLMVALLFGVAAAPPMSRALEPPRPGEVERFRKFKEWEPRRAFARELGNHKIRPGRLIEALRKARRTAQSAAGVSPDTAGPMAQAYAPPPAMAGMPTRGNVKVFALLIDFPDYPHGNTQSYVNNRLFGNGDPAEFPYESLAAYYYRSSYGQLLLHGGTTLGWYRTSYNRSAVSQTRQGRESLIKEAVTYFRNQGHDFGPYDNDGDGTIDYFLVIWSGPDNGWGGFWPQADSQASRPRTERVSRSRGRRRGARARPGARSSSPRAPRGRNASALAGYQSATARGWRCARILRSLVTSCSPCSIAVA